MPVIGEMLRAVLAEDILPLFQVVMVKRREEHHRQDDRQQPGGKYASFHEHSGGKDTKKKNYSVSLKPWLPYCIQKRFPN